VRRLNDSVCVQLPEILYLLDSSEVSFILSRRYSLQVRVAVALGNRVTYFTAAVAADVFLVLGFALAIFVVTVVVIVFGLVLLILAAKGILAGLSAAPPHFATPVTLMQLATPVEVLLLVVLAAAGLALLYAGVEFAFALDKLLDSSLVLVSLLSQVLLLFLETLILIHVLVGLLSLGFELSLEAANLLF
jgi:hypothetical protein